MTKRELSDLRASSILVNGSANLLAFRMTLHLLFYLSHSELLSFTQMCHTFFFFNLWGFKLTLASGIFSHTTHSIPASPSRSPHPHELRCPPLWLTPSAPSPSLSECLATLIVDVGYISSTPQECKLWEVRENTKQQKGLWLA